MSAHLPRIARAALAICLCSAGVPAFAEEEFSERWLEQREFEMTNDLTTLIERENSDAVARKVVIQLASSIPTARASGLRDAVGPAAPDFSSTTGGASETSTMRCHADPSGSYACVFRLAP